jgi:putative peptidoglycan lipid II flippase
MTERPEPNRDHVGRAGVLLASGTVVSRILGFIGAILLARTLGTVGSGADAFALANQLPNNIYALVAGGILTAILVPHIVKAGANADGGAGYVNKIVTLGIVIFLGFAVLATLLAPLLVTLYAQQGGGGVRGFSDADMALATALAYWCLPQVLFYALYSMFGEVLNARKIYGPFTWAPVLNNIVFISGLLLFGRLFGSSNTANAVEWSAEMVALIGGAATAGIAVQALILMLFWRRAGLHYRPDFRWRGVGLAQTGKAAGWLFGMILLVQIAGVVQANVATLATSEGQPGLAVLRFSWLLFMVPHSVITVSLATAYFTRMSSHASRGDTDSVVADVTVSLRRIGALMVLAAAGLATLSVPFAALFGGDESTIVAMGVVISAYALGLVSFSLVFVVQRVFYSLDDTRTPFLFQIVHTAVFIGLAVAASSLSSNQLAAGIALSASVASTAQLLVALWLLRRKLPGLPVGKILARLIGFVGASAPAVIAGVALVAGAGSLIIPGLERSSIGFALLTIVVVGAVMTLMYVGLLLLLRSSDMREILQAIRRLIHRVFTGRE